MSPARARARRGEGERLREELLAAAEALLAETADEGAVSIRAIAERVGVTPPSIYRHFADKDALLMAVCEQVFARLDEAMERAAAASPEPAAGLRARGEAYVRFGLAHPESYRLLFMQQQRKTDAADLDSRELAGSRAFHHLQEAVARVLGIGDDGAGIEDCEPGGPAYALTCAMWTGVHGITSLRISWPDFPWPPLEQQVAVLCGDGRMVPAMPALSPPVRAATAAASPRPGSKAKGRSTR